jgi:hypothetical protein
MAFREVYTGPARVVVGLYDPVSMERVVVDSGGTMAVLPTTLNVKAGPD